MTSIDPLYSFLELYDPTSKCCLGRGRLCTAGPLGPPRPPSASGAAGAAGPRGSHVVAKREYVSAPSASIASDSELATQMLAPLSKKKSTSTSLNVAKLSAQ